MKKLLIAAALTAFAVSTVPCFVGQAQAATAKNPLCALAGSQKNPMGWDEYYGCFGARPAPQASRVALRGRPGPAKDPYCNLAGGQKNLVAWNAYYHCLGTAPRPSRVALRGRPAPAKDPYCKLAGGQKNLVAWNAYYHCL